MGIIIKYETVKLAEIVIQYWGETNFEDLFFQAISGKHKTSTSAYLYHFSNSHMISKDVIYGEINKVKYNTRHSELVNEDKLEYKETELTELFEFCRFCIFPNHTMVISSKSKFDSDEFLKTFLDLFRKNCSELISRLELHYIRDEEDIFKIIKGFKRMTYVKIHEIRKSNPDPRPTFEKIEKFLDDENTDVYSAEFKSESDIGLNRSLSSHIMSAISLAGAGYGECKFLGLKENGESISIDTRENIIQARIVRVDQDKPVEFIKIVVKRFPKYIKVEIKL